MYLLFLLSRIFAQGVLRRPFREGKLVLVLFLGNSVIIDLDRVGLDFVHKKNFFLMFVIMKLTIVTVAS